MASRKNLQNELTPWTDEKYLSRVFGKFLDNPDQTLEENSREGIDLYNRMLRVDANLAECFHKRTTNVLSLGFDILPGDDSPRAVEIAEFIAEVFDGIPNLPVSRERMFRGISHGYAPSEIIFTPRPDGRIGIAGFRGRNPERFRFDKDNNLVYITGMGIQGDVMPREKFVLNTWGGDESPYGNGLLRELYPLWHFKSTGLKALVRFVEKAGAGYLIGQYPKGTQQGEIENLLDALKHMNSNNVAAIPEGSNVDFKQADNANVVNLFEFMIDRFVHQGYTLAVLGQTTSTETQSGTFALAKFQSKGEQRLIEQDAQWHESQMQPVVKFLVDINFGPQPVYPIFSVPYEENKDIVSMLAGYKAAAEVGLPIQKRWALEQLGFPIPEGLEEAELDEMLELPQPVSPFGGFGAGQEEEPDPDDEKADGLSESGGRVRLSEKKKNAFAAEWTRLLEELTATAKKTGWAEYEKYRVDLERQIMQAQSFIEIKTWTKPQAEKFLTAHFQDVIRQAQLTGRALYWQNIAKTFTGDPSYLDKWLKQHPQAANLPGMLAKLDTDADLSGLGLMNERNAWQFFRDKIPMTRDAFDRLSEKAKLKAFTVARLEDKNSIAAIQGQVDKALSSGLSLEDFKVEAAQIFDAAGITPASSYHLDTVYLTNVHTQANAARWNELKNDTSPLREFFPALRYVTAGDEAVRPEHAALEGVTLDRDDPAWNTIYPPNGFNCRCQVVEVAAMELEDGSERMTQDFAGGRPDEGFDHPPA